MIDEIEHIEEEDILEPEIIDDAESQESITVEEAIASNDIEKDEMIVQEGPQIENESAPNEAISLKPEHDALEQEFSQLEKENLEYRQELETYYKDLSNHAQEMKDKGLYDRYEETRDEMNRVSARLDELTKERLANSKEYYAEIHDIKNNGSLETTEKESNEAINEAVSEITNSSPQQINTLPIDANAQGDDITTFERPMDFGRFAHEAYELAAYNAFDDIEKEYPVIIMDQDGNEQNGKIDTLIVENDKNFIIDYKQIT